MKLFDVQRDYYNYTNMSKRSMTEDYGTYFPCCESGIAHNCKNTLKITKQQNKTYK